MNFMAQDSLRIMPPQWPQLFIFYSIEESHASTVTFIRKMFTTFYALKSNDFNFCD